MQYIKEKPDAYTDDVLEYLSVEFFVCFENSGMLRELEKGLKSDLPEMIYIVASVKFL